MYILGINAYHGDAAAAIVKDGELIAAVEEEHFNRVKHRAGFPTGKVAELASPILHDDRKPLGRWFEAQTRYTMLEANKLLAADPSTLSWTDRIRRWRVVAPPAVFFYCLIIRGGIFDGWPGWYYAFQRLLAELMLSLYLIDHDLQENFGLRISNFGFEQTNRRRVDAEISNQPRINADSADRIEKKLEDNEEAASPFEVV